MKILYKQPEKDQSGSLIAFGIQNCYFKEISVERDFNRVKKKKHHHSCFEMHIITEGFQEYDVEGKAYRLEKGSFLLIYPKTQHTVISSSSHTRKYAVTFNKRTDMSLCCYLGLVSERMADNIAFILNEVLMKKEISVILTENALLEIIVSAFRLSGFKENDIIFGQDENTSISLAKQYIKDNIATDLSVADVSEYCYLSPRQFTRIFQKSEGISPGKYIINERIKIIEKLLAEQNLSLKQISSIMNFDNEYYFNSFFKKYSGMPPGEYRKMFGK